MMVVNVMTLINLMTTFISTRWDLCLLLWRNGRRRRRITKVTLADWRNQWYDFSCFWFLVLWYFWSFTFDTSGLSLLNSKITSILSSNCWHKVASSLVTRIFDELSEWRNVEETRLHNYLIMNEQVDLWDKEPVVKNEGRKMDWIGGRTDRKGRAKKRIQSEATTVILASNMFLWWFWRRVR